MLAWIVDNASLVYVALGLIALALGTAWWLHRRARTLLFAVGVIGLIALVWLLTLVVPTDRKRIVAALWDMAAAARDNRPNDLVKHWAKDFAYRDRQRDDLARAITRAAATFRVDGINLWDFDFKSVSADQAEIWFHCAAHAPDGALPMLCKAHFVKEGTGWKLRRISFFRAIASTNEELALPI